MSGFEIVSLNYKLLDEKTIAFYRVVKHHKKKLKIKGKITQFKKDATQQEIESIVDLSKNEMSKLMIDLTKNRFSPRLKNQKDNLFHIKIKEDLEAEQLSDLKDKLEKKLADRLENLSFGELIEGHIEDTTIHFIIRYFNDAETIKIIIAEMKRKLILEQTFIAKRIYFNEASFTYEVLYPHNFEGKF